MSSVNNLIKIRTTKVNLYCIKVEPMISPMIL